MSSSPTRLILHATCSESLTRARNNAKNYLLQEPSAQVEIVANAGAVVAALDTPQDTDNLLRLCGNTLKNSKREASTQKVVPAAIVYLVEKQKEGWLYIHA